MRNSMTDSSPTATESEAKRRKVRKGTRSCWECKRRKLRCLYEPEHTSSPSISNVNANVICIGCRGRKTKCVSQEFPEEVSEPVDKVRQMRDRVVRVEDQLERLIEKVGRDEKTAGGEAASEDGRYSAAGMQTPASTDSESSRPMTLREHSEDYCIVPVRTLDGLVGLHKLPSSLNGSSKSGKTHSLTQVLLKTLPSREDTKMVFEASRKIPIFSGVSTAPEGLLEIPGPDQHPTLIARHMLLLATFLQHLHPDVHKEIKWLSEQPRAITKRLANTAIALVTTNDDLVGSIEGLECITMEAEYHLNWGNLRKSLIATRRAITVAQLMGLHRSVPCRVLDTKVTNIRPDPLSIWFRLLHCDRALCLLLGLPQSSVDQSMASDATVANDTPTGHLERMHSAIASRILARNESKASPHDFALTQDIDAELQKAAKSLPIKWWLMPNLPSVANHQQTLHVDTLRLVNQMFHYNLLNLLHLPHMLLPSTEHKYEYSKMMCVNASREMLSRFIMFRTFNRIASSYRVIDFLVLIASMTLLLAHMDSHRSSSPNNFLAHQSLSDRAMIEKAQENMVEVGILNDDPLSTQSAEFLRRLAAIEVQVADGSLNLFPSLPCTVQIPGSEGKQLEEDDDNRFVPGADANSIMAGLCAQFDIVKLCQEMRTLKEMPKPRSSVPSNSQDQHTELAKNDPNSQPSSEPPIQSVSYHGGGESPSMLQPMPDGFAQRTPFTDDMVATAPFAPQFPSSVSDTLLQYQYPDLTAGVEDWTFQGVDLAFVDSLTRGSGDPENGDREWLTWPSQA